MSGSFAPPRRRLWAWRRVRDSGLLARFVECDLADHVLQFVVEELPLRHEISVHSYTGGGVHLRQNPDALLAKLQD